MITKIKNGKVITDRKIQCADVYFEDGKIIAVTNENLEADTEIDAKGKYVAPGFIEIHTHGAADFDFLDNDPEGFIKIAEAHAEHGAGSILPTITSADKESTIESIKVFDSIKSKNTTGANLLGIH